MLDETKIVQFFKDGLSIKGITEIVRTEENIIRKMSAEKKNKMTDKEARYIVETAIIKNYNSIYSS